MEGKKDRKLTPVGLLWKTKQGQSLIKKGRKGDFEKMALADIQNMKTKAEKELGRGNHSCEGREADESSTS